MARWGGSIGHGIAAFSGMVAFIGTLSLAPHISVYKDDDSTYIRYKHFKPAPSTPPPANQGLIISPSPKDPVLSGSPPRQKHHHDPKDWILDTGATAHVCSHRQFLHSYSNFNPFSGKPNPSIVSYFGPNPISMHGVGDVTFVLDPIDSVTPGQGLRQINRITVKGVMYIPEAGINIISWSQLKRSKGMTLGLMEARDGTLLVHDRGKPIMQFKLRDGLYYLEHNSDRVQTGG